MDTKEHYSPINLLVDILGCFQFGVIMNKVAMNTLVPVFVYVYFHFFWMNEWKCCVIGQFYKKLPESFPGGQQLRIHWPMRDMWV